MVVVENRVGVAGVGQVGRQRRLPDSFRQPRAARRHAEAALDVGAHPRQLAVPVTLGECREDRLEHAAAQDLDLVALDQRAQPIERLGLVGRHPFQQRTRVVQREADRRVLFEGTDHRLVRLLEYFRDHPPEVAHRLVVVDDQGERDPRRQPRERERPAVAAWGAAAPLRAAGR